MSPTAGLRNALWVTLAVLALAARAQEAPLPDDAEIDAAHPTAAAVPAPVPASGPAAPVLALYRQALQAQAGAHAAPAEAARAALQALDAHCAAVPAAAVPAATAPCEYRRRWRLQALLAIAAREAGAFDSGLGHARAALELARAGNDAWRQAFIESELARLAQALKDPDGARQHLVLAQHLAAAVPAGKAAGPAAGRATGPATGAVPDAGLGIRLLLVEAGLATAQGDTAQARRTLQQALAAARQRQQPRQQALAWAALAALELQAARPRPALAAADQGLAAAAAARDPLLARHLRAHALLAHTALGRHAQARREFEALQAEWAAEGATGPQARLVRAYGDALADAGQLAPALELLHRERKLSQQRMAAEREATLAALRTRYDREAQQRSILQLERDNAVKSAALANQRLTQRLWALGAGVLALAMVLLLLWLARVRSSNRVLARRQARLRVQSERDALTGLSNRRHFQAVLKAEGRDTGFRGALLMVDIDHFKRINDQHGHGTGDAVLVAVAQRVHDAVRQADTVARWGGEEFLVFAPGLGRGEADALAQRLLQAVAGTPVLLPDGTALRASVSIGQAVFPLPPQRVPLRPEQAVNLVDMALYTAKSQGRNRAVGIVQAEAADAEGLRRLEADFERAWQDGHVQLRIDTGPAS